MTALWRPKLAWKNTFAVMSCDGAKVQVAATSHMLQAYQAQEASSIWSHMRTGQGFPETGVLRRHWAV